MLTTCFWYNYNIAGNFGNKTNIFIPCAYMSCYAKAFWSGVGLCICVLIYGCCVYKVFCVCVCTVPGWACSTSREL